MAVSWGMFKALVEALDVEDNEPLWFIDYHPVHDGGVTIRRHDTLGLMIQTWESEKVAAVERVEAVEMSTTEERD